VKYLNEENIEILSKKIKKVSASKSTSIGEKNKDLLIIKVAVA
jgi:hypothetical protein